MKELVQTIATLDEWQQIAFGAAMVSRMYPNFALFCEVVENEDSHLFTNMLNLVWEYASGDNLTIDFQKQQDKLEIVTPDPEQFDIYGVRPALDAVVGLSSLLSACQRFDAGEIHSLILLSQSTIEHYLIASGNEMAAEEVALLVADNECAKEVIHLLSASYADGRNKTVKALKQWVARLEESNIGLAIST
ncbi:MAG: DUF416 family protein [Pseudomonadales bacterium]